MMVTEQPVLSFLASKSPMIDKKGQSWGIALIASMAGLMFGLDTGIMAGALDFIQREFNLKPNSAELQQIVSSMMLGAALGSLLASPLSYRIGTRKAMTIAAVLFVVGAIICAFSLSSWELIIGRFLLGIAIGTVAFAAPVYISEISIESKRGAMITLYQLMVTVGIFMAFIIDSILAMGGHWRWMLGCVALPGIVFLIGTLTLPTSPRWLVARDRKSEAFEVLKKLRDTTLQASKELDGIVAQRRVKKAGGFRLLQNQPNFRRTVALGIALQFFQQLTGINVVIYYAPQIFKMGGFGLNAAIWATTLVGLVNILTTLLAVMYTDKWGRRPLMIASCIIMAISLLFVGVLIPFSENSVFVSVLVVVAVLFFIIGFAIGAGPIVWMICSEVQPLQGREFGVAASTFSNWVANYIITSLFLTILGYFASYGDAGKSYTFWLFMLFNVAFLIFTYFWLPETKDVTLEEIEDNLMSGKRLRDIGQQISE